MTSVRWRWTMAYEWNMLHEWKEFKANVTSEQLFKSPPNINTTVCTHNKFSTTDVVLMFPDVSWHPRRPRVLLFTLGYFEVATREYSQTKPGYRKHVISCTLRPWVVQNQRDTNTKPPTHVYTCGLHLSQSLSAVHCWWLKKGT